MNEMPNPYNQQPQQRSKVLPPKQGRRTVWQQHFLGGNNCRPLTLLQERSVPSWLIGKSVLFFFVAFAACTLAWGNPMNLDFAVISALSILLFFYGVQASSRSWAKVREKVFLRNVLIFGFLARLVWVLYGYFFFNPEYYDNTYGSGADVDWYIPFGQDIAQWISDGFPVPFKTVMDRNLAAIDDVGYPIWLGIIYLLTFNSSDVFLPFLVKCITGAYCAICIYHVAKRHFGEGTARMAALFVALNPNMIYWCGSMMKEAEMVFLCCLCVDLVDRTFSSGTKLTFRGLLPGLLVGVYIFFYRAPLAIVIFLAMFAHIVMASNKVMSAGKKIIAGVMVGIVLLVGMGDRLRTQTERIRENVENNNELQQKNFEWRSRRENGNAFALYASRTVFAPLIFSIPFPTFNEVKAEQIAQQQTSGGSYIKNIFSYFVLLVMFLMLISGEWRRHVFIMAYTLGYLVTLVLSNYAHSGRFHMPIWPMILLFAAYGVQISKGNLKYRRWFWAVLVLEIFACLAWNWFKLKGRGMI